MKVLVYRKHLLWRVKLVAANGETMMVSEPYASRSNAVRAAQRLREVFLKYGEPCPKCGGSGRINSADASAECSNCEGTGRV